MENVAGADLAWFWRGWFMETDALDQAMDEVKQKLDKKDNKWVVTATMLNLDELVMPVQYKVTYEDGTTETRKLPVEIWYPSNRFNEKWRSDKKVTKVEIDPSHVFPDYDRRNNIWPEPVEDNEESADEKNEK